MTEIGYEQRRRVDRLGIYPSWPSQSETLGRHNTAGQSAVTEHDRMALSSNMVRMLEPRSWNVAAMHICRSASRCAECNLAMDFTKLIVFARMRVD
jgi:hypothetical protein